MRMGMSPDESRCGGSRNFVRALTRFSGRKPPDRPDVGCDAVEDRTPLGEKNSGGTSRFLTSNWQGKVKAKENNENLRQASGKGPKRKKFFLPSRRACCLLLSLLSHFCFCRSCGFLARGLRAHGSSRPKRRRACPLRFRSLRPDLRGVSKKVSAAQSLSRHRWRRR
jgi:hypothetical protein